MQTITEERAQEIISRAKNKAKYGPWGDMIECHMTDEEMRTVKAFWNQFSGNFSWFAAFSFFAYRKAIVHNDLNCDTHSKVEALRVTYWLRDHRPDLFKTLIGETL